MIAGFDRFLTHGFNAGNWEGKRSFTLSIVTDCLFENSIFRLKMILKVLDGIDYAAQIAEKNTAAESIAQEIATIGDDIATLNAQRKAKEAELKKLNKEITKLEKKKADADEKIAAELNRKKAEDIVANALASGMTAEEIAELLK